MAKKKNDGSAFMMAAILILAAVSGSVVVLAAQKYNAVQEQHSQAEADKAYAELLLDKASRDVEVEE